MDELQCIYTTQQILELKYHDEKMYGGGVVKLHEFFVLEWSEQRTHWPIALTPRKGRQRQQPQPVTLLTELSESSNSDHSVILKDFAGLITAGLGPPAGTRCLRQLNVNTYFLAYLAMFYRVNIDFINDYILHRLLKNI